MVDGEIKPKLYQVIAEDTTNFGVEESARWTFKSLSLARAHARKEAKYIREMSKESDDYAGLFIVDVSTGEKIESWTTDLGEYNHTKMK
jgi:hypothetical protein